MAKSLALLDLVGMAGHPPTFAELATMSGLPRGTLHRLLAGLIEHGMVQIAPQERRYVPGVHLLELAQRTWANMDLRVAAAEAIVELNRQTGETVHLALLADDSVVYIDKVESPHALRLHSAVGKRGPIHCTAIGKVMAAYLDAAERRALVDRLVLPRCTPATLTSRPALWKALEAVRIEGVAFDREEHVVGIHCVAAPVLDFRGRCIGGISVTAPLLRVDPARLAGFARLVQAAAAATARQLGGTAGPSGAGARVTRRAA